MSEIGERVVVTGKWDDDTPFTMTGWITDLEEVEEGVRYNLTFTIQQFSPETVKLCYGKDPEGWSPGDE